MGDGAVGKTCLLSRYLGGEFTTDYKETIGADFSLKYEAIQLNHEPSPRQFKFQIWDIAGQPRYTQVGNILYDKSDGALLVFDVANRMSFTNCEHWMNAYVPHAGIGVVCLIGNKVDSRQEQDLDLVTTEEGQNLARQISEKFSRIVHYLDTSAKTGHNVEKEFQILAKSYLALSNSDHFLSDINGLRS